MNNWFPEFYPHEANEDKWTFERNKMVSEQIKARSIKNEKVLKAMLKVERHLFVPENLKNSAYTDNPLPIGYGQTISQPYIVAFMTEALELSENDKVLEIGTGCGYQTAIIAEITKEIYTIEIVKELNEFAGNLIKKLGYNNVKAMWGDGYNGWPEHAPFDSIIITAAPHKLPLRLIDQLKVGGKMIVPVGSGWHQELKSITRTSDGIETKFLLDVRFVPMTGQMEREH